MLDFIYEVLLPYPLGAHAHLLVLQGRDGLVEFGKFFLVIFALDSFTFYLKLFEVTGELVEFLRHAVSLHTEFGCCLVHKVDSLIGQETVGDITFGKCYGGYAGIILNTHAVVVFVALFQSTQDRDGREFVRLVNHNYLESTFECLVLLEILLVFVEGGSTYGTQLTTRQGRFEDVGCIHSALATSCTHEGVNLIDEEHYLALRLYYTVDDALETFLELAFVLGTSDEGTHIEGVDLLVLEVLGHIASHYALGESLGNSCFTSTRLAYEDRVVLGTS